MVDFTVHTPETAPADAKPKLEQSKKNFGMIPNLHGVMAESPQMLEAYQVLTRLVTQSSLSKEDYHIVWLAINVANRCHYCVPAHTMLAKSDGVEDDVIDALRNNQPIADSRKETLRQFTIKVTEKRGDVSEADLQTFLDAGFTKANVLDVILAQAHKVLSNYTNHVAHTPVDAPFAKFEWDVPAREAAE